MYLYRQHKGIFGRLQQEQSTAITMGVCLTDCALCLGQNGQVFRYADGAWTTTQDAGDLSTGNGEMIFVDSRGHVFVSFTSSQGLWRSTDRGVTFAQVNTVDADAKDSVRSMTEDDKGHLYHVVYSGGTTVSSSRLYKSTDEGETWTDITANGSFSYPRHDHIIYFCPHSKLLFWSGGDGSNQPVQVSSDYGATFTNWDEAPSQTTAIISDADYIYLAGDHTADNDLHRAANDGTDPAVAGTTPEKVFDHPAGEGASGFVWDFYLDDAGRLIAVFNHGTALATVYVSENQGDSWELLYTSDQDHFAFYRSTINDGSFAGLWICTDGRYLAGRATAWRIMSNAQQIGVSPSGSKLADGINGDKAEILDYEDLSGKHAQVLLHADYTSPLRLYSLDKLSGGLQYGITAAAPVADDTTTQDFESTTWTENNQTDSTINQADTTDPHGGTRHGSFAYGTGSGTHWAQIRDVDFFAGAADGDELWLSGWCNVNVADVTADLTLMQVSDTALDVQCKLNASEQYEMGITLNGVHIYRQGTPTYVTMPLQEYVHLKMRIVKHESAGRVTIWANDAIVIDVDGVPTYASPSKLLNTPNFGFVSSQTNMEVYWDDIVCTINKDPDLDDSLELAGTHQEVRGLVQVSQQINIGGTDNRAIACAAVSPSVVPYKLTGTNAKFYQGVLSGGTVGVTNEGTGEVKNSIFTGQSTSAVTNSGTLTTAGNRYDGTFGVTPDASDTLGAHGLADPSSGDFTPDAEDKGVFLGTYYDSAGRKYDYIPQRGALHQRFGAPTELPANGLVTDAGDYLVTESGDYLVWA